MHRTHRPQNASEKFGLVYAAAASDKRNQLHLNKKGEIHYATAYQRAVLWMKDALPKNMRKYMLSAEARQNGITTAKGEMNYYVAKNFQESLLADFQIPTPSRTRNYLQEVLLGDSVRGKKLDTSQVKEVYSAATTWRAQMLKMEASLKIRPLKSEPSVAGKSRKSATSPTPTTKPIEAKTEEPLESLPPQALPPEINLPEELRSKAQEQQNQAQQNNGVAEEPMPTLPEEDEDLPAPISMIPKQGESLESLPPQALPKEINNPPAQEGSVQQPEEDEDLPAPISAIAQKQTAETEAVKTEETAKATLAQPKGLAQAKEFGVLKEPEQSNIARLQDKKCLTPPSDAKDFYVERQKRMFCGKHSLHAVFGQELISEKRWVDILATGLAEAFGGRENIPPDFLPTSGESEMNHVINVANILRDEGVIKFPEANSEYITTQQMASEAQRNALADKVQNYEGDRMILGIGPHFTACRRDDKGDWWHLDSQNYNKPAEPLDFAKLLKTSGGESVALATFGNKIF